ncbi:MATE family efflux transporter [Saccharospirillum sp. MSK14-1]|uniref:MATE family efflux transporter n=1 Tax=Saccharospirillum sp. MSK14-1 TaxID=1897632 RepID=UPI0018EEAA72|nr:MATE family efflux transporter [Saccharospirillum sp. MSK14-1]
MTASNARSGASFLHDDLTSLFARTALPIIAIMLMNGLLTVVDAWFLGVFVGADALGAVTLVFPAFMLMVALSTLISAGMSSLLARHLGAGRTEQAQGVFVAAQGLALLTSLVLMALYLLWGGSFTQAAAQGRTELSQMAQIYLRIIVFTSPLMFSLGVQGDALRNEGRAGWMAMMGLVVTLSNMLFNFVLIVVFELGVAGSAYGTAAAQCLALLLIFGLRLRGGTRLQWQWHAGFQRLDEWLHRWRDILKLGAPSSLSFFGMALISATIIASLNAQDTPNYAATVSAYGIVTRLMTLCFMPMLGLSHALQTICGHNHGAQLWQRSDDALRLGLSVALCYGVLVELTLVFFAAPIGRLFVDDPLVVAEVARILPVMVALYFLSGPMLMLGAYFQSLGDATRAALFSLTRPYLLTLPLLLMLPLLLGERGIWLAMPTAEGSMLVIALVVLAQTERRLGLRRGVFQASRL